MNEKNYYATTFDFPNTLPNYLKKLIVNLRFYTSS